MDTLSTLRNLSVHSTGKENKRQVEREGQSFLMKGCVVNAGDVKKENMFKLQLIWQGNQACKLSSDSMLIVLRFEVKSELIYSI